MNIDRINKGVEFLKDGQSFNAEDIRLGIEGGTITVTGWSQYSNIMNLTKNQSLSELEGIKALLYKWLMYQRN